MVVDGRNLSIQKNYREKKMVLGCCDSIEIRKMQKKNEEKRGQYRWKKNEKRYENMDGKI